MVSQGRWSLVAGSVILKCETFCQEYVVLQDRWSFMAVVSQDIFQCVGVCCTNFYVVLMYAMLV